MVVKAEEYGPVRRIVLNCSIDSLSLEPPLHCTRVFFWERSGAAFDGVPFFPFKYWDAEDRIILGYISRPFGLSLHVLGNVSPRLGPWALM